MSQTCVRLGQKIMNEAKNRYHTVRKRRGMDTSLAILNNNNTALRGKGANWYWIVSIGFVCFVLPYSDGWWRCIAEWNIVFPNSHVKLTSETCHLVIGICCTSYRTVGRSSSTFSICLFDYLNGSEKGFWPSTSSSSYYSSELISLGKVYDSDLDLT